MARLRCAPVRHSVLGALAAWPLAVRGPVGAGVLMVLVPGLATPQYCLGQRKMLE